MGDHVNEGPEDHWTPEEPVDVAVVPTQVAEPGQAVKRSTVQQILSSGLTLLIILPLVMGIFAEHLEPYLPESWYAWLVGAVALISAIGAAVTKVMSLPAVDAWLSKLNLSASKEG